MPKSNTRRKVPQTLASATSKWGLNGEERVALLRNLRKTERPQRRASQLRTSPSPTGGRRWGGQGRGKLGPRDGTPTKLQTGSQFLTKDFLRF